MTKELENSSLPEIIEENDVVSCIDDIETNTVQSNKDDDDRISCLEKQQDELKKALLEFKNMVADLKQENEALKASISEKNVDMMDQIKTEVFGEVLVEALRELRAHITLKIEQQHENIQKHLKRDRIRCMSMISKKIRYRDFNTVEVKINHDEIDAGCQAMHEGDVLLDMQLCTGDTQQKLFEEAYGFPPATLRVAQYKDNVDLIAIINAYITYCERSSQLHHDGVYISTRYQKLCEKLRSFEPIDAEVKEMCKLRFTLSGIQYDPRELDWKSILEDYRKQARACMPK